MIKVNIENDDIRIVMSGNASSITTEVATEISYIYNTIKGQSLSKAEAFRNLLTLLMIDEESPVWNDEGEMDGTVIMSLE